MRRAPAGLAPAAARTAALAVTLAAAACASDIAEPRGPRLELAGDTVDFGTVHDVVTTNLRNPGESPLQWQIQGAPGWLSVQPASGTLEPGATQTVELGIVRDATPLGLSLVDLVVASNVFTGPVGFAVRVDVPPTPALELVSVGVIEYPAQAGSIVIRNDGRGPLHYEASPDVSWAELSNASGAVNDGQTRELTVRIQRANVSRDTVVHVTLVSNGLAEPMVVPVPVTGNPPPRHVTAAISFAEFVDGRLVYSAGDATHQLDYRTGDRSTLHGVPAVEGIAGDPVGGRFAVRHGSQVSVFEAGATTPFRTVDMGEPLAGIAYLNGLVYVIPAVADAGRIIAIDPASGNATAHLTTLPPFSNVTNTWGIVVTTVDGIFRLDLDSDPPEVPGYGGTGLVFDHGDGRFWSAGYLFTSGGQVFFDNPPGLQMLGQLRTEAGAAVDAVRSVSINAHDHLTHRIAVIGHTAGEGWRVRVGDLAAADIHLAAFPLQPVRWNDADYEAEPRLAVWVQGELVVLEEVTTGPAAGQWFLSRSWLW